MEDQRGSRLSWQLSWQQAGAATKASFMMRRMVRAQRPHWGLQPRQWYTSPAVRGESWPAARAPRTSWSVNTLQEQTIMADRPGGNWFDL
jgi:hypothetical protein